MKKFDNVTLNNIQCPYCQSIQDFTGINSMSKLVELVEKEYTCKNPECRRKFKVEPICSINPKINRDPVTDLFSRFKVVNNGLSVGQSIAREAKVLSEDLFIGRDFDDTDFEEALSEYNQRIELFVSSQKEQGHLDNKLTIKFVGNRERGLSYIIRYNNKFTNLIISPSDNPILDDFYNRLAFYVDCINIQKRNLCKVCIKL